MSPLFRNVLKGAVLGALGWVAYRQLIAIDPLDSIDLPGHLVAATAGAAIGTTRLRSLLWLGVGSIAAVLMVVAYTPIIVQPARSLIRRDPPASVDAVVVLASGLSDDELLDQSAVDRILSGVELLRSIRSTNLVLTRYTIDVRGRVLSTTPDQQRLTATLPVGVKTYVVDSVYSTRDEALRIRPLFTGHGWTRVALVTSPSHSRRACATFEKAGIPVVCAPSLERGLAFGSLRTSQDRLKAFRLWSYEMVARIEYERRGWL